MKFVRYADGGESRWGFERDERIYDLADVGAGRTSLTDIADRAFVDRVGETLETGALSVTPRADVRVLEPVPTPGKIVCVGLNYFDHADEQDEEPPDSPILFAKAPTSVIAPGAPIRYPADIEKLDYEVELAAIIGRTARSVIRDDAPDHVAGYTVLNDVSARDVQFADGQWFRGKSYDTFAPMGPALIDEASIDPHDLALSLRVNGQTKQRSSTAELVFDVYDLVEFISRAMTLRPGDVISTGTPAGVGIFRDPPDLLEPGDVVEAEIEGIGVLENEVVGPDVAD